MNIKKVYEIKQALEGKMDRISSPVEYRWKKLTGDQCFTGWHLESGKDGEFVVCGFVWRGETDSIDIPIRFFEMEDEEEAAAEYKKYRTELQKKEQRDYEERKEAEEKREFERLKQKFGE